jgi:hypothetical protein
MPSEVSIVGGDPSMEELRLELAEARDQQAATAEILRVLKLSDRPSARVRGDCGKRGSPLRCL